MPMRALVMLMLLSCTLLTAGCGGSDTAEVSGTVTLDSQLLEVGSIIFEDPEGKTTPAGGTITNGRYSFQVPPGLKKVRISASKPPAKPDPVLGMAPVVPMIPKQYNLETKLSASLKPGKQDEVNFDLLSKP